MVLSGESLLAGERKRCTLGISLFNRGRTICGQMRRKKFVKFCLFHSYARRVGSGGDDGGYKAIDGAQIAYPVIGETREEH